MVGRAQGQESPGDAADAEAGCGGGEGVTLARRASEGPNNLDVLLVPGPLGKRRVFGPSLARLSTADQAKRLFSASRRE